MYTFLVYVAFCVIIGLFGTNKKFGFWGYFFCSLALTPLIGVIVLLGSDKKKRNLES